MVPLKYNIRSVTRRRKTAIATALGIALVVFVLASSVMLVNGVEKTLTLTGRPDVAVVISTGANAELESIIDQEAAKLTLDRPEVKRDDGRPAGYVEMTTVLALKKVAGGTSNLMIRGTTEEGFRYRPELQIVEGRMAKPGTHECVIGRGIRGRFQGIDLASSFEFRRGRPAEIVGVFASNGSSYESELFCDRDYLQKSFGREGLVSSARIVLTTPSAFDSFRDAIQRDKRLALKAWRETTYYEKQSDGVAPLLTGIGVIVCFFFGVGATLGAMITMYSAVANRTREVGTLRALGFSRGSILLSFLFEATLLTVIGGTIGALASLAMGGVSFSMLGSGFAEVVFRFDPTPKAILTGVLSAAIMGIVGGFFPALRAARMSPVVAMRVR